MFRNQNFQSHFINLNINGIILVKQNQNLSLEDFKIKSHFTYAKQTSTTDLPKSNSKNCVKFQENSKKSHTNFSNFVTESLIDIEMKDLTKLPVEKTIDATEKANIYDLIKQKKIIEGGFYYN